MALDERVDCTPVALVDERVHEHERTLPLPRNARDLLAPNLLGPPWSGVQSGTSAVHR